MGYSKIRHVSGKMLRARAYSELGSKGFSTFWKRFGEAKLEMDGPVGDVCVCGSDCLKKTSKLKC